MSMQGLVLTFAAAAGVIALWLETRFEARTPEALWSVVMHLGASLCAMKLTPLLLHIVVSDSSPLSKLVGLFGIVLPVLTYVFLSSIWLIKQMQSALRLR
jgi:hypothetical protein